MGTYIPIKSNISTYKNIVYSDTVLDLKSLGKNIKVTTLSNVSEFMFNKCLQVIFDSNNDVLFNTIQYSKNNKKVYFYTDKEINLDKWYEIIITNYKPLKNKKEILEEIKKIISLEDMYDEESISIYNVFKIIDKYFNKIEKTKNCFKSTIEENANSTSNGRFIVHGYSFNKNELNCSYAPTIYSDYKDMIFGYENNEVYLKKSDSYYAKDIFPFVSSDICNYINYLYEVKDITENYKVGIKPINSNFFIDVFFYSVSIKNVKDLFCEDFKLQWKNYNKRFEYECNSSCVLDAIKGNEEIIFKNIFVNIKDCPIWMQEELYKIRKKELRNKKMKKTSLSYRLLKK